MEFTEAKEQIEKITFNPLEKESHAYDASMGDLDMLSTLEMTPRLDVVKLDS